jgi:membrane protein implicated in regulation of membrane protease activity
MSAPTTDPLIVSLATLEPTWEHALRVWWSWQWRLLIATILIGLFINLWLGTVGGAVGLTARGFAIARPILSFVFSGLVSLYLFKDILDRDFGKFRVCIVPTDQK